MCKYLSATVNAFKKKVKYNKCSHYFLMSYTSPQKSKQVTVIQREKNIGQLVTFNLVSGRRRRKEILKK